MPARKPVVAGSFYPDKFEELAGEIDNFLQKTNTVSQDGKLKILIVPHAGIVFSGQTAAWGFKQIEGKNYKKIYLLGVSHKSLFNNAIIYDKGKWETPFGQSEIDEITSAKFLNPEFAENNNDGFNEEHGLELELIFLQRLLKNFKIIPILLGQTSKGTLDFLAETISNNFDDETLLVVSTDLSHYPDWETANKVDNQTIGAILSGSVDIFNKTLQDIAVKNYLNLDTCVCGKDAVEVALIVANKLKINLFSKIFYENSGDISGDKTRVVGYTAIGGWKEDEKINIEYLDSESKNETLSIVRKTLTEFLSTKKVLDIYPKNKILTENLGAFVTLKKNGNLRGCIGLFEPDFPLYEVLQKMAIAAATQDNRFTPVEKDELKDIKIEVSIMTPKRKIEDWKTIELGKHGVLIKKGLNTGTFLPQVATETGWDLDEFLNQLCVQKAGLQLGCYKDPNVEIYIFEAQIFSE